MKCLTITGTVGKDASLAYSQNGVPYVRFSVAVYNGKENDHPKTLWVECTAFKKTAELFSARLVKGSKVCVQGNPDLKQFTRGDGSAGASIVLTVDAMDVFDKPAALPAATQTTQEPYSAAGVIDETF